MYTFCLHLAIRKGWAIIKKIATPLVLLKYRKVRRTLTQECNRRKGLSIFEYQALAQSLPYAARHITKGMNLYGFSHILSQYAGIKNVNSRLGIEHGLYFSKSGKSDANIITFSDYREKFLLTAHSKAIKIGPYIHYAPPLLNKLEQSALKKKLGKVLLIFPTHSIDALTSTYDVEKFINFIEEKRVQFDTVVVCLFWKDIQLGKDAPYKKMGYSIATAGHMYDIYFMSRLKTIIELSDTVIANDLGTNLGYCVYMQKPFCLFSQTVERQAGLSQKDFNKEINQRTTKEWQDVDAIRNEFTSLCQNFNIPISEELQQKTSYIFGFNHIKDKKSLKKLLK